MLPGDFESDLTVGAQGNFKNTVRVTASGRDFPGPGVKTVSGGATTTGQETRVEEMNAGIYVQETLGFAGKLFLTGGLRADGNSAFGNEFDYQLYPKAALAYSVSEESWWPSNSIPTMKLRFAYGTSGLAPSQFAADRTWSPIAAEAGQPAVTPGNLGDPDLGPEKSSEFELGFDAGLLGDRLGLEVTAYFQTTANALLEKQAPPSLGFQSAQFTNIGEVKNRGVEVSLLALLMRSENFEWNSSFHFSTQHNEVTDLGGLTPFSAGGDTRITEGYPVQGKWGRRIESWDPVEREHTQTSERFYVGSTDPSWFGAVATDVRFGSFSVRVSGDFAGGHIQQNFSRWWSIRVKTGDDYLSLVSKPDGTPTLASDSILDYALTGGGVDPMFISDADWFVLREISLGYELPDALLGGIGMRGSTLTLSARNLKEWTVYDGISPQTNWNGGGNFIGGGEDFNTMAPLRTFIVTFRTAF